MLIELYTPLQFSEQGKRNYNEDSLFPSHANDLTRLFIVCDGVGGSKHGEVASALACQSMNEYFDEHQKPKTSAEIEDFIKQAFGYTQQAFDDFLAQNEEKRGMATTLVMGYFHSEGLTVAHCGDSRLYQIRGKKIIFQTHDHSAVNELVEQGVLTPEEAAQTPKSGRITRAIQGASVRRTRLDIQTITDIAKNDYVLICSDGVYEGITNEELASILQSEQTNEEKCNILKTLCEANSKDNYTAHIIQIKKVSNTATTSYNTTTETGENTGNKFFSWIRNLTT